MESTPKNAERNSNEGVVLSRSRGSPGQWFPKTEYLPASAIFVVGTSGILPNLNYRSVSPIDVSDHRVKLIDVAVLESAVRPGFGRRVHKASDS